MYEYKSVTLIDFFLNDEIKRRRKEFLVENSEKRVINFMNLFLNYYASQGWELVTIHRIDNSLPAAVDMLAKNQSVVSSIFFEAITPKQHGGAFEFYIFRRLTASSSSNFSGSQAQAHAHAPSSTIEVVDSSSAKDKLVSLGYKISYVRGLDGKSKYEVKKNSEVNYFSTPEEFIDYAKSIEN
jgi:hypothetical protein